MRYRHSERAPVIVGVGESDAVGVVPNKSSMQLHAEASHAAVADAGLRISDIDGLLTNESYHDYQVRHAMAFGEYLGVSSDVRAVTSVPIGSAASSGLFIQYAANLVLAGECDTVLCATADDFLSGMSRGGAVQALADNRDKEFEAPYAPLLPAVFAMLAQRYLHDHATTPEQLASVPVTMRHHASMNPRAHKRDPITVEDVLASRYVSRPLRLLMCSLVSDGGAALVVTTRERARDLKKPYVEILACEASFRSGDSRYMHNSLSQVGDLTAVGTRFSARKALELAKLRHSDIDVLMMYDPFAIMPILLLEAAGFVPEGEGGAFFAAGEARVGGSLPVNPHGGLLSYAHPGNPGGAFMITELVRQLRGESGDRQVADARHGMILGFGGQHAVYPATVLGVAQ